MKKTTIGALLLFFLAAIGIVGYYFLRPMIFEKLQRDTSDSANIAYTINIAGDNYLGYWFITSPEMRKHALRKGIQVKWTDDGGVYAERLQKFSDREYDAIVLPINSYLQHGGKHKFPGVIVAAISESKGADGIVGFGDKFPTDKVNTLNNPNLRIVYTAESPSSFLLDLTIVDFDLAQLQATNEWRVEVDGSREVYQRAKKNDGDVFVLWEPDLSRALKLPGMKYLWGSDKFSGYIIDVFVFRREFLDDNKQAVLDFFKTYFQVMGIYANNRDKMVSEMSQSTGLKDNQIDDLLDKIDWYNLAENCREQFGIPERVGDPANDGVINTIIACTDVMLRTHALDSDPLDGNPYLITNSTILEELSKKLKTTRVGQTGGAPVDFAPLDEDGWNQLREIGALRVEPVTFQTWNNLLTPEGKEKVDKIAQLLKNNYPNYRVAVRGHTGPGGDEAENIKLSLARAQAVVQYLKAVHNIDPNRLRAQGMGSSQPPEKLPGESPRAYRYRLSRVEFVILENNPL